MLNNGNGVGERFARARLRLDETVLAGKYVWYGLLLDERERGQFEPLLQTVDEMGAQRELRYGTRRENALLDHTCRVDAFFFTRRLLVY